MSFTNDEIAEYYESTQIHYEKSWKLKTALSLHYGFWFPETKTLAESLSNTNDEILKRARVTGTDYVLDAGCGVGGAALHIHGKTGAKVAGITLSETQAKVGKAEIAKRGLEDELSIEIQDFNQTSFPDETFDVVWACESASHAQDHLVFFKECFRQLKPGGRLVIADYFLTEAGKADKSGVLEKWRNIWGMCQFHGIDEYAGLMKDAGFSTVEHFDYTENIQKTAKYMLRQSQLGTIPCELYALYNPKVSRFARSHYKSGYYQYRALKRKLWEYKIVVAEKL